MNFFPLLIAGPGKIALRLMGMILVVSFFLSPLAPVFAQEADPGAGSETPVAEELLTEEPSEADTSTETSEEPVVEESDPTPTDPTEETSSEEVSESEISELTEESEEDSLLEEELEPEEDSLMSSSGGDQGTGEAVDYAAAGAQAKVDAFGALVQKIQIEVPPGRNGLQPDLSLLYNSLQYEDGSLVGFGWGLTIPYIERLNRTGVDRLYTDNYFSSSMYGELASTSVPGEYRPRTENGDFVKFVFQNNIWTAYDKQGTQYKYGSTTGSQVYDTASSTQVGVWMLQEVRDTNNNYIKYNYQKSDNQIYPSTIIYTGNESTDGIFSVSFSRQTRPDPIFSYKYGFLVETKDRINQITVAVSSSTVRSYALAYTSGNNGYRSMLSSVTETYVNPDGTSVAYAPWQFAYTNQTLSFTDQVEKEEGGYRSPAFVRTDLNGNGLLDIVASFVDWSPAVQKNLRVINNGNFSFTSSGTFSPGSTDVQVTWANANPSPSWLVSSDPGVRLMDINGDALPDVVQSYVCQVTCSTSIQQYFLNLGNGQWQSTAATTTGWNYIVRDQPGTSIPHATIAIIGNVNGDTVDDIFPYEVNYFASTGGGSPRWTSNQGQLVDLNHDGLDDAFARFGTTASTSINRGGTIGITTASTSFSYTATFNGPSAYEDNVDKGIRIMDINNDGLPDLVRSYLFSGGYSSHGDGQYVPQDTSSSTQIYINTGVGWTRMQNPPAIPVISNPSSQSGFWTGAQLIEAVWDQDGDGDAEIGTYTNNMSRQDLLKQITLPTGGYVYATSTPTTQQFTGSQAHHPNSVVPVWTVSEITHDDGNGTRETSRYSYKDGTLWYGGINNRKYAGFASTTESYYGLTTKYYHQGDETDSSRGEYQDSFAKIGKMYRVERTNNDGVVYAKTIYKWDQATTTYGNVFAKLVQKVDMEYNGDGTHKDRAETYTYDNASGNLTEKKEWGEVTASDDGSFSDTGSDIFVTTYTYATVNASSTVSLLASQLKTDQGANTVNESKFYYDSQSFGSATVGNLTKAEKRINPTTFASTTKTYNSYGLPTQQKDENNNATTYVYDAFNLYPATSTNALSQSTKYQYNYALGKLATTTDSNNQTWVKKYDGHGRLLEVQVPDPATSTARVIKTTYTYTDTPLAVSVKKSSYLDATNIVDSYTYYDGLGHAIQTKQEAEGGEWITKDVSYNVRGRVFTETLPYPTTNYVKSSPTATTTLYTNYMYDPLNRVTESHTVVGTTTNTYDDWKKTVTNPLGIAKSFYNDAYDNLVRVDETNSGSTYTTLYTWDGNGALTGITDALSNIRSFTYDMLGRRTQATDLRASGDGTYGTYTYTYDPAGNMKSKVTPVGSTINYTYDALNRLKTEDYTGQAGTETTYTYDACTLGAGKLCVASSTASVVGYAYTPAGLVKTATTTVLGTPTVFTTSSTYDRQGNQTTLTYPDGMEVKYTYNAGGYIETVQKKEASEGSFSNIVSNFNYSPVGQVSRTEYANGAVTTNTYDPATLYRLSNKQTILGGSQQAQNISYSYDALGNILQVTDASNTAAAKTVNYSYDDLSRLVTASTTNATSSPNYRYTYAYNALGNITNGPLGVYTYAGTNYANPHAATAIATTSGGGGGVATTTTHTVFADALTPGWNDWSYNAVLDLNATTTYAGSKAIKVTYSVAWGGSYLQKTAGIQVGTSTALQLALRSTSSSPDVTIDIYGTNDAYLGYADPTDYIGGPIAANTWYLLTIPFSDFGATSTISGIVVARDTPGVLYIDELKTVATSTGGGGSVATTTLAYDANGNLTSDGTFTYTWDYLNRMTQSGNGTATSTYAYDQDGNRVKIVEAGVTTIFPNKFYNAMLGGAGTTTKHIYAGDMLLSTIENTNTAAATTTTHTVFTDALAAGWNDWSYNATLNVNETAVVYSGAKSAKITYSAPWGGAYIQKTGVNVSTSTALQFAIRQPVTTVDVDLDIYGANDQYLGYVNIENFVPGGVLLSNTWQVATIPLSAMGATSTITGIVFARDATGTLYLDDIKFIATSTSGSPATSTVRYIHTDHLGGTNVVTNASGAVVETIDYYPYGETRLDAKVGTYGGEKNKYAGTEYDAGSGLNYMQARYQSPTRGNFISQDPVFWEIDITNDGKAVLSNPQLQNSYSYAGNNPIVSKDPSGRFLDTILDLGFIAYDVYKVGQAAFTGGNVGEQLGYLGLDVAGAAVPFVTGAGVAARGVKAANAVADAAGGANKAGNAAQAANTAVKSLPDSTLVCRGGGCSVESFIKGSNEGRAGLNPSPTTPLTGVSVNMGGSKNALISNLPGDYPKAGFTFTNQIQKLGGNAVSSPSLNNPFHGLINGLSAQQLNNIFKVEKIK